MEKLLVGFTIVIILLACIPMKSVSITESEMNQVNATITYESDSKQIIYLQVVNAMELNNSELVQTKNLEIEYAVIESNQVAGYSDRGVFISIGSLVFLGIFLLLPSFKLT
jgi:hypothetical protein